MYLAPDSKTKEAFKRDLFEAIPCFLGLSEHDHNKLQSKELQACLEKSYIQQTFQTYQKSQ